MKMYIEQYCKYKPFIRELQENERKKPFTAIYLAKTAEKQQKSHIFVVQYLIFVLTKRRPKGLYIRQKAYFCIRNESVGFLFLNNHTRQVVGRSPCPYGESVAPRCYARVAMDFRKLCFRVIKAALSGCQSTAFTRSKGSFDKTTRKPSHHKR